MRHEISFPVEKLHFREVDVDCSIGDELIDGRRRLSISRARWKLDKNGGGCYLYELKLQLDMLKLI